MYFFGLKHKRRSSKQRRKRRSSKRKQRRSNKRVEFYTKDGRLVSFVPKGRKGSKRRRSGRMSNKKARHIRRATKAMKLYQSGRAKTLKQAWRMV
jgi:hypothetical protein